MKNIWKLFSVVRKCEHKKFDKDKIKSSLVETSS